MNRTKAETSSRGSSAPSVRRLEVEHWGSRLGVILAVSGSAVGLGNFLRFPGQAAANGAGAFLIPYFISLVLLGVPICWAEWSIGRYGGRHGLHSAPSILGAIGGSAWRYVGALAVVIPLIVSFVYTFIASWCLAYFVAYLTGAIGIDPAAGVSDQVAASQGFYGALTGNDRNGFLFGPLLVPTIGFWAVTFALNLFLIYRGVSKGIERFVSLAMPVMAVCAIFVLVRVLTLGTPDPTQPDRNVISGLGFMWNPDYTALADPSTWLAAAGQVFFSISVGYGAIINYASYLRKNDDVALSGLTAVATNEVFEIGFGGLITLTASFVFLGLSGTIAAASAGTFGLGFQTLPVVFAQMGSLGPSIGAIWFFMLFLAAVTSSLSMYQPAAAFFQEALGIDRRRAVLVVLILCAIGSLAVVYFTHGAVFWATIDFWVGTLLLLVTALLEIICFGWVLGIDTGWQELHRGALMRIPRVFRLIMKYVAPAYLLIVLGAFCLTNLPGSLQQVSREPLAQGALVLVAAMILVCVLIVRYSAVRYQEGERHATPPLNAKRETSGGTEEIER